MTDLRRLLDGDYRMMWRAGRVDEALRGLGDDVEWVVADHPAGAVRHGPESVALATIDMHGRGRASCAPTEVRE